MKKKELLNKLNVLTGFEKNMVSLINRPPESLKKQTVLRKFKDIKRSHKKHIKILDEIINKIKKEKPRAY